MTAQSLALLCSVALAYCMAIALGGCGEGSPAVSTESTPSRMSDMVPHKPNTVPSGKHIDGRPVQFRVMEVDGSQRIRIRSGQFGWCPDIPHSRPRITGVRENDLTGRVRLTVYLVGGPIPGCAEVSVIAEKIVWLRQPRKGRPIYDGSQSPSVQRWPVVLAGKEK
jgi:hypothetical protein